MPQGFAASAVRDAEGYRQTGGAGGKSFPLGPDMSDPSLLRALLEQAPDATAVVDADNLVCTFANAAFRDLGVDAGPSLPQQFPAATTSLLNAARRAGKPQRDRAATGVDGRRWDVQATPILGADGSVRALLVTARPAPADTVEHEGQLREVSHRAKNTLQLVSSLLTLQALGTKDPEIRRAFQNAGGRIGMVTQAHQRAHTALTRSDVDFAEHLRELCAELEASLTAVHGPRIIRVQAEPTRLPVDSVIPLTLIVNELVTNAVKHAYGPAETGRVEVTLGRGEDGGLHLTVADHGHGLPPGMEVSRATTLGFKIARAFATQMKGKLRAEPNHPGTRLILDLPG